MSRAHGLVTARSSESFDRAPMRILSDAGSCESSYHTYRGPGTLYKIEPPPILVVPGRLLDWSSQCSETGRHPYWVSPYVVTVDQAEVVAGIPYGTANASVSPPESKLPEGLV